MRKAKQIPAIRFKGFDDEWMIKKIIDCAPLQRGFDLPSTKIVSGIYPVVMSNGINCYHSKFKVKGPGVITGRSGTIGKVHYVIENYWPHNTSLWVTNFKGNIPLYIYYLYKKMNLNKFSTGSGVPTLNRNDIHEQKVYIPNPTEQSKIGTFFSSLDCLITKHQQKHDKLTTLKKAMLEKMFPQNGTLIPEIRFKGFTEEWEETTFANCFTERTQRSSVGELISVTINTGIKKFKDLGRYDKSSENKSNYKRVEIGDIAYNSMRMWQGASGYSNYSGILSPAYTVIVPKKNMDSLFFSYMIKKPELINIFQKRSQGITSDTWNLKYPAFSKIQTKHPKFQEQQKIGHYFSNLDNLILLEQKQIDKLKNIKKACLEKMFV